MYKKTISDLKDFIIKDKKLSYFQVLKLSIRICFIFYLPIFVFTALVYVLNKSFT